MPKQHPSARQRGFTLIEMLVVMVVLGFLVVALTQGVRTGLAMWHAQQQRLGQTADLDTSARLLRGLLTGIAAPTPGGFGPGTAPGGEIKGDAGRFSFVGDLPTGLGTTRRADITLELSDKRLVLRWTPDLHEIPFGPPAKPTVTELIAGVKGLEIAYWGAPDTDQPAAWQSRWDGPAPPELIRIGLTFAKGDRRHWPLLIVAPQL